MTDGNEACECDGFTGFQRERAWTGSQSGAARAFHPTGSVAAAIIGVHSVDPADAMEGAAFAGGFPVVIHGPFADFIRFIAIGRGDEQAAGK